MKIGDTVASTLCSMKGKIVAILLDDTGIIEVNGIRIYDNLKYWVKVDDTNEVN